MRDDRREPSWLDYYDQLRGPGEGSPSAALSWAAASYARRNMPGRLGDPVEELTARFVRWAMLGGWQTGEHVDSAFDRWVAQYTAVPA